MDINDTLQRMRHSVNGWTESETEDFDYADDMVSYFQAIDEWLSKGGFLPEAWNTYTLEQESITTDRSNS